MPCYYPLHGWRARRPEKSGRYRVVFNPSQGMRDLPITVPCGQCIGCRLERSRQWAVRCVHEAQLHERNCFITLTFDDEHLPSGGSLDVTVCQKFYKRLRKNLVRCVIYTQASTVLRPVVLIITLVYSVWILTTKSYGR